MKKRILSVALTLCMLFSVLPQVVFAVGNTTTAKDITLGYAALHEADTTNAKWDYVYFGTYNNSPIKWRVLSTKGNSTTVGTSEDTATYKTAGDTAYTGKALFMLSENTLGNDTVFSYNNNTYQGSALQTAMKGIFSSDSKELKYVLKTTKTDSSETIGYINPYNNNQYSVTWGGSSLSEDTLFALSAREVEQYLGSGEKYANRASGNAAWWWLRSPDSDFTDIAGVVINDGYVGCSYVDYINYGVRPALNLNLSSVLFTSAAVGGKSSNAAAGGVTENSNLSAITGNDGYKLTLLDESRANFTAELKSISGNTATVSYSGATPGTNEYISVIIKNGDTVKYYGRVAAASTASGTVDITLPSDFSTANGDVLCVFNEQYNGNKMTDYASKLIDVLFDYTVNFDANGATGTMASQTMTYGATANLSANTFTRNGYTFNGWNTKADGTGTEYSDGQSVTNLVSDASEKSVTLYAQWKIIDYNISYTLNDGTATNPTAYTVESENITLTNPTKSGYTFTGWSGTGLTGENNMTVIIPKGSTGNRNYVAHYSVKSNYTVTFDTAGGTSVNTKINVKWTDKVLDGISEPTRDGYKFTGWKCENVTVTTNTTYADLAESDTVMSVPLTAQWKDITAPVITGIENGKTYCSAQTITVSDNDGIASVTVNGEPVTLTNGTFILLSAKVEQKIIVTDKAGNQTEMTVTVNDGHTGGTADCTHKAKCEVCGEEYGEVNSANHDFTKQVKSADTLKSAATCRDEAVYYYTCSRCGEIEKNDTHTFEGELDSSNHAKALGDWQSNDDGHWKAYICCPTVKESEGKHTYEWQSENGQYWQKCTVCNHETANKDIPEITINGSDKVCNGHDYTFTFTLPEEMKNPTAGYDCGGTGSELAVNNPDENGIYTVTVSADAYKKGYDNGASEIEVTIGAETTDGYTVIASKTITIQSEHTGGTADCTHKAKCEICGEEYGEVNADNHTTLKHIEAKAATTETEGNIEYWHCEDCNKYFSDKEGKNEIKLADTVIAKLVKTDNTTPTNDKSDTSPKTSENNAILWLVVELISIGVLASIGICLKKKKFWLK